MDLSDLKRLKREAGITNAEIAKLSGIPVSTVNKIFSGATKNPRYATLLAIEQVLMSKEKIPFVYDKLKENPAVARDAETPYMLSAPDRLHQYFVAELLFQIKSYIRANNGRCDVYAFPFDVRLFGDDSAIVQPDILVVCNKGILTEKGCSGAPDWVIEIVSKSNSSHDYVRKLMQYHKAGVREYWIVDPFQEMISVFNFEDAKKSGEYGYEEAVESGVLKGLEIRFGEIAEGY